MDGHLQNSDQDDIFHGYSWGVVYMRLKPIPTEMELYKSATLNDLDRKTKSI